MPLTLIADQPDLVKSHPPRVEQCGIQPADDLTALAARIVATWPALSAGRKAELGRLLAS
jgi:hypothetical protein